MQSKTHDLVVIGAGPAGSSAARRGAQLGLDVLLIEKKPMPRIKVCGGAVSARALGYLDFELPEGLVDRECFGARVSYGGSRTIATLGNRIAVLVRREHFDHFLVEKACEAGAEFALGEVIALRYVENGVSIETRDARFLARAAVIAQGATGNLIQHVRPPDGKEESGICLECRLPTKKPDRELEGLIDVYLGFPKSGYGWIFNHGTFSSIGIGGLRSLLKQPRSAFHEFCHRLGIEVADRDVRGQVIPCFGHHRKLVADRLLLAGDAAGFVDPFCGEGISYAIRSGQLAVESAAKWMKRGELSARRLAEYARNCYGEFGRDLRYALFLWNLVQRCPSIFLKRLASDRSLLERCIEAPLRRSGYRDFLWRLILKPAGTS